MSDLVHWPNHLELQSLALHPLTETVTNRNSHPSQKSDNKPLEQPGPIPLTPKTGYARRLREVEKTCAGPERVRMNRESGWMWKRVYERLMIQVDRERPVEHRCIVVGGCSCSNLGIALARYQRWKPYHCRRRLTMAYCPAC